MFETREMLKVKVENSSCIEGFEYYKGTKTLRVLFKRGGHFDYTDIEEEVVRKWMLEGVNGSYGKYYNREIKTKRKEKMNG